MSTVDFIWDAPLIILYKLIDNLQVTVSTVDK